MRISGEKQRLIMAAVLLGWCAALLLCRAVVGRDGGGIWMGWNLFLAAVPLGWSYGFRWAMERRKTVLAIASFALWLLFLPNAPYILTDLIHLAPRPRVPLWFVLALLLSCAGTGTLLGYHSLLNVQSAIEARFGKTSGWLVAVGALMSCGFGIYLGRFLRWNSWDAFTNPGALGRAIARQWRDPGEFPHPFQVTVIFGFGLLVGYLALRALMAPSLAASAKPSPP